jgi:hypothetical protein
VAHQYHECRNCDLLLGTPNAHHACSQSKRLERMADRAVKLETALRDAVRACEDRARGLRTAAADGVHGVQFDDDAKKRLECGAMAADHCADAVRFLLKTALED